MPLLRPVTDTDAPDVLALNERNVEALAPLGEDRFAQLRGWADRRFHALPGPAIKRHLLGAAITGACAVVTVSLLQWLQWELPEGAEGASAADVVVLGAFGRYTLVRTDILTGWTDCA